jgi:hypothetical protein
MELSAITRREAWNKRALGGVCVLVYPCFGVSIDIQLCIEGKCTVRGAVVLVSFDVEEGWSLAKLSKARYYFIGDIPVGLKGTIREWVGERKTGLDTGEKKLKTERKPYPSARKEDP